MSKENLQSEIQQLKTEMAELRKAFARPRPGPRIFSRTSGVLGTLLVALVMGSVIYAVTVPNTFTNNTVADATEVNANFTALADAITALETNQAKVTVTQVQFINTWSLTPTDLDQEVEWNLAQIQGASVGASLVNIVDDSGMTRTKFVALKPVRVNVSVFWQADILNRSARFFKNGVGIARGQRSSVATGVADGNAAVFLDTGDVLTIGTDTAAESFPMTMLITGEASLGSL